jgi:hypothetical protein
MPYIKNPIIYPSGFVSVDVAKVNQNFSILADAFYNSDPENNPINRACYVGATPPNNPKVGQLWLDISVNPPVLKVYDGVNWQSKISLADNAVNATNADKIDGFHASQTPAPNVIVPLDANGILDLSATYVKSNVYTFRRVDLTNATSDYFLQVGEEAIINFTNKTSVPLRIATQSGTYYEMDLISFVPIKTGSAGPIFLNPNNTTYSNAFKFMNVFINDNSGVLGGRTTYSAFRITWAGAHTRIYIHNVTVAKSVKSLSHLWESVNSCSLSMELTYWDDTSTDWISLGTITFPQSYSGYILVRRLA